MRVPLHLDIAATHLRLAVESAEPSWASRLFRSQRKALIASAEDSPRTEIVLEYDLVDSNDPVERVVSAAGQALQSFRERNPTLDTRCSLTVRLSTAFATLAIATLDRSAPSGLTQRQLQLVAQAVAQQDGGLESNSREVRWQLQPDGEHLCIVTLRSELIGKLQALCDEGGIKLCSFQPALVARLEETLAENAGRPTPYTMVWTELDYSGRRYPLVSFVRVSQGSVVQAWRAQVPLPEDCAQALTDDCLDQSINRFFIAAGALEEEEVVLLSWPDFAHGTVHLAPPIAEVELQA